MIPAHPHLALVHADSVPSARSPTPQVSLLRIRAEAEDIYFEPDRPASLRRFSASRTVPGTCST